MINIKVNRSFLLNYLIESGDLIKRGDYLEDMGGHFIHESQDFIVDCYIEDMLRDMSKDELKELVKEIGDL